MNADEAIKAHAHWRIRLASYLHHPDGSLEPEHIRAHDRCALGGWMYGEGARHRELAEFQALEEAHDAFHGVAADLVQEAGLLSPVNLHVALSPDGAFGRASSLVASRIKALALKISTIETRETCHEHE